jgi:hypothetical protein
VKIKGSLLVSIYLALALAVPVVVGDDLPNRDDGVKKEFETMYARQAELTKKRDLKGLMEFNAPEHSVKLLNGKSFSRDDLEKRLTYFFTSGILVRQISFTYTVTEVTTKENEAVVLVEQKDKRVQVRDGKEHEIEADVIHRDTWKKTPQGWKRRLTEEVKQTKFTVDGKPVELPK